MQSTSNDLDARYDRATTAERLTAAGFPVAKKTLETMASRGGGPIYQKFGAKPLYRWGDALDWAQGRLSKPIRTSSELEAA